MPKDPKAPAFSVYPWTHDEEETGPLVVFPASEGDIDEGLLIAQEIAQLRIDLDHSRAKVEALRHALDQAAKGVTMIPGYPVAQGAYLLDQNTAREWRAQLERVKKNLEGLRAPGHSTYRREELREASLQEIEKILAALPKAEEKGGAH